MPGGGGAGTKQLLSAVGVVLIVGALANWFIPEDDSKSVVTEVTPPTEQTQMTEPGAITEVTNESKDEAKNETSHSQDSGAGDNKNSSSDSSSDTASETDTSKSTTTASGTTTTTAIKTTKKTTTTTPGSGRRSEGVTLAILGTGLLLLFAGTGKIKSLGLPGGLTLTLEGGEEVEAALETLKKNVEKKDAALGRAVTILAKRVKALEAARPDR